MKRILSVNEAIKIINTLKRNRQTIVLAGGCFDILHLGHVKFLETAKQNGEVLFVFVESDKAVRKIKGKGRPINTQQERAQVLSSIRAVDYVVKIPFLKTNKEYDNLVVKLQPSILAAVKGSGQMEHNLRQAKLTGAKIFEIIEKIPNRSTSKIAGIIIKENQL